MDRKALSSSAIHNPLSTIAVWLGAVFSVWGPGQRPDLALEAFRRRIEAGQPVMINGDGTQRHLKS
jgi:nucleoside-diphosphate-sugar epimerase